MRTYLAMLRGINVSGQKMIKMEALRAMFTAAGFVDTKTYIQSGNVIFGSNDSESTDLASQISGLILQHFSFEVPVLVLTKTELSTIVNNNPYFTSLTEDTKPLHIVFLSDIPDAANVAKIEASKYLPDVFTLIGKVVYLKCPNGYGNTKLHNSFLENKLKVTATTRNWKTVNELLGMFD